MISSSRKYERNSCFYLWIYKDDVDPQLVPLPTNNQLYLPITKKYYKTTLKNIKVYINELVDFDNTIVKVEIERATHIGSVERKQIVESSQITEGPSKDNIFNEIEDIK